MIGGLRSFAVNQVRIVLGLLVLLGLKAKGLQDVGGADSGKIKTRWVVAGW